MKQSSPLITFTNWYPNHRRYIRTISVQIKQGAADSLTQAYNSFIKSVADIIHVGVVDKVAGTRQGVSTSAGGRANQVGLQQLLIMVWLACRNQLDILA